jgi:hypothetical protein
MKKLLLLIASIPALSCAAQKNNWFISATTGVSFWGPAASLRAQLNHQGFNHPTENLFGWGNNHNPKRSSNLYFLVQFGRALQSKGNLYFTGGLSDGGNISGFKRTGTGDIFGWTFEVGDRPTVFYELYQLSAGYLWNSKTGRPKLGVSAASFLFRYHINDQQQHASLVPGVLLTGRFPLGKQRKTFGIDLVMDGRWAVPVHMKDELKNESNAFHPGTVGFTSLCLGLAFSVKG